MTSGTGCRRGGPVYWPGVTPDLTTRSHNLYTRALWLTALLPMPALLVPLDPQYRTAGYLVWVACYAAFLLLMRVTRGHAARLAPIAQSLLALTAAAAQATTAEGAMLVVVAARLAGRVSPGAAIGAAVLQTLVFAWLLGRTRPIEIAVDVPLAWLAFEVFAILMTHVALSEARGRTELIERNLELLATRQALADRSRAAERLRMARDLHDGFGHHLAALSLNLEAAAHLSPPDANEHIRRAQSVARALLADVRATISGIRDEGLDPMPAIRALAGTLDAPHIHVSGPESLPLAEPAVGDTLVRVVQEIVTNALRHAGAGNLWISISTAADSLLIEGRDDGRGAASWQSGNGLRGMGERIGAVGGSLDITSAPGAGFLVRARIPLGGAA